jgi:glycosylphosphatidylinositol phospholipase D
MAFFITLLAPTVAAAPVVIDLDASASSHLGRQIDNDQVGRSVAVLGDINGDGIADLLVSSPGGGQAGAYVVFGRANGLPPDISLDALSGGDGFVLHTDDSGTGLGAAVTGLGDINGDGIADFAVGAPYANVRPDASTTLYFAGKVYVVFGHDAAHPFVPTLNLDALNGSDGFRLEGTHGDSRIGYALADAGDFDGDGIDDLLVGTAGTSSVQEAWVLRGSSTPFDAALNMDDMVAEGHGFAFTAPLNADATGTDFATAVAGIGDVDGDGKGDVALGAPGFDQTGDSGLIGSVGCAYVVHGRQSAATPASNTLALDNPATPGVVRLDGSTGGDFAGSALAAVGDIDGDGIDDFVVGEPGHNAYTGAAYVIFGSSVLASEPLDSLVGAGGGFRIDDSDTSNPNPNLGAALAGGVDLNGDGVSDIVVGVPGGVGPGSRNGAVYVIPGRAADADPWPSEIDLAAQDAGMRLDGVSLINPYAVGDLRGTLSLAVGGDVNGDGLADLLIGSTNAESADPVNGPWQGRAWLPIGPPYDDTIFKDGFELPASP